MLHKFLFLLSPKSWNLIFTEVQRRENSDIIWCFKLIPWKSQLFYHLGSFELTFGTYIIYNYFLNSWLTLLYSWSWPSSTLPKITLAKMILLLAIRKPGCSRYPAHWGASDKLTFPAFLYLFILQLKNLKICHL